MTRSLETDTRKGRLVLAPPVAGCALQFRVGVAARTRTKLLAAGVLLLLLSSALVLSLRACGRNHPPGRHQRNVFAVEMSLFDLEPDEELLGGLVDILSKNPNWRQRELAFAGIGQVGKRVQWSGELLRSLQDQASITTRIVEHGEALLFKSSGPDYDGSTHRQMWLLVFNLHVTPRIGHVLTFSGSDEVPELSGFVLWSESGASYPSIHAGLYEGRTEITAVTPGSVSGHLELIFLGKCYRYREECYRSLVRVSGEFEIQRRQDHSE